MHCLLKILQSSMGSNHCQPSACCTKRPCCAPLGKGVPISGSIPLVMAGVRSLCQTISSWFTVSANETTAGALAQLPTKIIQDEVSIVGAQLMIAYSVEIGEKKTTTAATVSRCRFQTMLARTPWKARSRDTKSTFYHLIDHDDTYVYHPLRSDDSSPIYGHLSPV